MRCNVFLGREEFLIIEVSGKSMAARDAKLPQITPPVSTFYTTDKLPCLLLQMKMVSMSESQQQIKQELLSCLGSKALPRHTITIELARWKHSHSTLTQATRSTKQSKF